MTKRTARRRRPFSPERLREIEKSMETVRCAFCEGKGKDPWGVLSELSNCQVCLGRGEVRVKGPTTRCRFCEGSGIQPYTTSRLHCQACGGRGVVTAIEPSDACPTCDGGGVYPERPQPLACPRCKGQGVIRRRRAA